MAQTHGASESCNIPVQSAGGKGAYAVVDPVAGPFAEQLTASVREGGTYLCYSRLGGFTANVGIKDLLYRGVKVCRHHGCPQPS